MAWLLIVVLIFRSLSINTEFDLEYLLSRLAKEKKAEFPFGNEYFFDEERADIMDRLYLDQTITL